MSNTLQSMHMHCRQDLRSPDNLDVNVSNGGFRMTTHTILIIDTLSQFNMITPLSAICTYPSQSERKSSPHFKQSFWQKRQNKISHDVADKFNELFVQINSSGFTVEFIYFPLTWLQGRKKSLLSWPKREKYKSAEVFVHVHRSHTQAPTMRSFRHVTLLAPRDSLSILKVFRKKQTQEREITLDDFGD